MSANEYLEDLSSLLSAVTLLHKLGYHYLSPNDNLTLRSGKTSKIILESILKEQLKKLNSITFKGQQYAFTDNNIQKAIQALTDIPFDSLMNTSEQVYDLLTLGKSLEQTIDGNTKSFSLDYIDWKHPENNVYHVADEFVVERRNSKQTRRPDIVLFVNGIPLVVIECKRPDKKNAVEEGISQQLRNQRGDEIPELFTVAQLLLSVSQNKAQYGTTGTDAKFWAIWKEEEDSQTQEKFLHNLVNEPVSTDFKTQFFSCRDEKQQRYMERLWQSGERLPSPQDKTLHSLLRPTRLLELIYQYIVFDNKEKKIARYQQYFAVKATLGRVTHQKGDSPRSGGVIWHTTGSGKSLTMVMLAKALILETSIHNPKIILVTDRVDLDDQIYKTFHACGKAVTQAKTGEHLLELIVHNKADIITTIIDKFESASHKRKISDKSSNIFVLVDESHRSQYGVSHAKMQNVFPNACYIGFTGTPLLQKEKTTAKKFGGFIHKYTMNQAVADGAVTPLLYEGRMSELHGDQAQIDKWFERITKDLSNVQKADLKKKFRREEELSKSEQRIAEIAYDIGQHFKNTFKGTGKKGQFAVSSKAMALSYKKQFDEFGDVLTEVLISPPDTREGNNTVDENSLDAVQAFWKSMMAKYGCDKKYQESVINAFKHSDEPEIIIVVDKLLTGFDAPRNTVLYLDKRLKEHGILQAIARVNRLFEDKDYGLIIDYRGIFGELNDAIDTYAALENEGFDLEDVEGTLTDVSEEIKLLSQRHTNVWEVFKEVKNQKDLEAMQLHLEPEDRRQRFYETLSLFAKTLQLALSNAKFQDETPISKINRYKDDLKYFLNLRQAVKQRYGETVDYSSYETQIRNMVNKYIGADAVKQLIEPVDVFAIDEFEKEIENIDGDAAKADAIASRLKKTITEKMEEDPALYKRLSEMIDEAIADHRAKRLSDLDYLQKIRQSLDKLRGNGHSDLPSVLNYRDEAKAYYGVIQESFAEYSVPSYTPAAFAAEIALRLETMLNTHKIRDWTKNQDIKNQMLNEVEDCLYSLKGRYELSLSLESIEEITHKILAIAERRDS